MKDFLKTTSIALSCLLVLSLGSCKSDKEMTPEEPSLSIGTLDGKPAPSKLQMSAEAGTEKLAITSNGKWEITKKADESDWLTVSPGNGDRNGQITISFTKNNGTNSREATLSFSVNGRDNVKSLIVSQLGSSPSFVVTPEAPESIKEGGEDITLTITSNDDNWEYSIPTEASWLTEKSKTSTSLTLTAAKNSGNERKTSIVFMLTNHPSLTQEIEITQDNAASYLVADMLDVQFNTDGTATDLSPMNHSVQKMSYDYPFSVIYNTDYKRNMVKFAPQSNGSNPGVENGSYYQIDYENNTTFKDKLADGHTFEVLVQFDFAYETDQSYETKFFSTHQAGGTGFLVTNSSQSTGANTITFLPNVPATDGGKSKWIWTNSKIKPDGQSWYHLVGVWDKDAGKSYFYVNGELKSEVDAQGFYRPASSGSQWVAIGGDSAPDYVQNLFQGSIAIARIYDQPLTAAQAQSLWDNAK